MIFFALLFVFVLFFSAVCAASLFALVEEETSRGVVGALAIPVPAVPAVPVAAVLFTVVAGHAVDQVVPVRAHSVSTTGGLQ
ncbi:hypothetical protein G6F46_013267 [Rhizopus delemar]|uniref:Secreted peptide n=2 Tax=Rhizopus TaxID=4842 RepID=A0A9P6YH26_9FUNG|nr:hypothetical protein G6F55_013183 [Rhizopus delemar]KAG1531960.1 hypothetical protein G6F51_013318 [Rhizopus arrhizus]KAG1486701.1 hypothetical protein G6F54_013154 [Rhizopus delemar]KAG1488436.1 hypothetical protein G6F52_013928 [Rhizopus delemar]KAG1490828.1 hypothetical protein G6F53_013196 [Rhizopus delemar]